MPRGTFIPFENPVRFFARPLAFTIECVYCGRLLFIGKGQRDAKCFDRSTHKVTDFVVLHRSRDPNDKIRLGGCGRSFYVGMVAYPIKPGHNARRNEPPEDAVPEFQQAQEIRAYMQGRFAKTPKRDADSMNQIEPPVDDPPTTKGTP